MKKILLGSAVLLSIAATPVLAGPNWNQISAAYVEVDVDDTSASLDGIEVTGTKLLNSNIFFAGKLASVSEDVVGGGELTLSNFSLGLGYRHPVANNTDIFGVLSYEDAEVELTGFGTASENGYGLKVGVRSLVTPKVELAATVSHIDIEDVSDTVLDISAQYLFTSNFSVGLGYRNNYNLFSELIEEDLSTLSFSGTYSF